MELLRQLIISIIIKYLSAKIHILNNAIDKAQAKLSNYINNHDEHEDV